MSRVWRPAVLFLLTVAVVGIAAWLVFFSPVLGVREIQVAGNAGLSAEQVRRAAQVVGGMPLATVDVAEVRARVAAIPQVESVKVSRTWPDTLRVEIVEREPVATVPTGGRSALMDRHGVVIEVRDVAPPILPVLRVVRPGPRDPATMAGLTVITALPGDLARRVAEVLAPSAETVSLRLKDGRSIVWGGGDRPADKAKILVTLLERRADSYDVSSPDVVTVK
ncbi:FtsQ-type POTRA domain-containing protein [Streptosporangium sp. NPDC023615]|uniref:cell division protein FtsQ/DivIB n=1 Tax=Streptosporangium sp. NPDC023615 TaxID=3154794 RepID=UPI0034259D20